MLTTGDDQSASVLPLSDILQRSWIIKMPGGNILARDVRLDPNGTFQGDGSPGVQLTSWRHDGLLSFVEDNGFVAVTFNIVERRDDGVWTLRGRWRRRIAEPQLISLEQDAPTIASVLSRFESLGDNCEFGLVQRYYGLEQPGLFRFTSTGYGVLTRILETRGEILDRTEEFEVTLNPMKEYAFRIKHLNMISHTDHYEHQITPADMLKKEIQKLGFLKRKLFEDLECGEKILVRKGEQPGEEGKIRALFARLRSYGPCRLLWVLAADAEHPAGRLDELDAGLCVGYVDRFAPYTMATLVSFDSWLRLCLKAAACEAFR